MNTTKIDAPAAVEKEKAPWEETHKAQNSNVAGPSVAPSELTEGGADPIVAAGAPGVCQTPSGGTFPASDGGFSFWMRTGSSTKRTVERRTFAGRSVWMVRPVLPRVRAAACASRSRTPTA